jgi:hypothetical protein
VSEAKLIDPVDKKTCSHRWSEPVYMPEQLGVPYGYETVERNGVTKTRPKGYEVKTFPRWVRECKICGQKEYLREL